MNIKKNIIKKCPSDTHKQFLEYAFCFFQEKNCKAILKGSIQKDTAHKFSDIDLVLKRMDKELVREFIFNFGEVVLISRTQRPLGILIVIYSDEKLKEQYRSGVIDWKKYNSLFKKLQKEVNEEADNKRRALFGGGVSGLQDIYDAVSKGTFRDTGQVTYGHGSAYYTDRRRTNPNCSESLANYASLCIGHPELIDILAEDYPEIVTALRGCVEAMLKEVPK